jgi:hypothetical protein
LADANSLRLAAVVVDGWLVLTSPFVERQSRNTLQPYQIDPAAYAAEFSLTGVAETNWEREHSPLLISMWGRVAVT